MPLKGQRIGAYGPGLFTRASVERRLGWNPQGGNHRQWRALLVRANIPQSDWSGPFTSRQVKRIMEEQYKRLGEREERRIIRELRKQRKEDRAAAAEGLTGE